MQGYRKWFGVSLPCAIREVELLGHEIDPAYKEKIMRLEEAKQRATEERKRKKEREEFDRKFPDSDENYYFIAGYTSNGVPYGITWEEYHRKYKDDNELEDDHFFNEAITEDESEIDWNFGRDDEDMDVPF